MNLYVMVGNIGSGKSTYVKKFLQSHPDVICISRDAFRYMIGGGNYVYNEALEPYIFLLEEQAIWFALKEGLDVIVDEVGMSKKHRLNYIDSADCHGYNITALIMPELTKDICVERRLTNSDRDTPKKVWEEVWDKFNNEYEEPTTEEGFNNIIFIK